MNCSDNIYHQNNFGFARKCTCQGAVHVNFGNVSILLNREQIHDFLQYITDAIMSSCDVTNHDDRSIYLPTRDYCLMFALTYNELNALAEILDQTLLMMEVEDVLL
ncbi:MAG TPA: DUF6686 family protein [Cyclobacteriaceae bacterium]